MADSVEKSPSTCVNDTSGGTKTWSNPGNAKSGITTYSTGIVRNVSPECDVIGYAKLVKGGTIQSTVKSKGITSKQSYSFGGSADGWSANLTPSDINASNFGVAIYAAPFLATGYTTNYLKATGFGFAIPSDAEIDGVEVSILADTYYQTMLDITMARVYTITITVYYTDSSGNQAVAILMHDCIV